MENSFAPLIKEANRTLMVDGHLAEIETFFSHDYIVHITGRAGEGGPKFVKSFIKSLRRSFSDLQVEVEILVEGEDRVAWQRTLRAIHKESFKGFPASGKSMVWRDMVVSQIQDGRIAEEWVITDLAEQLLLARKKNR